MKKWKQFGKMALSAILVCGLAIGLLPGQAVQSKAAALPATKGMEELARQAEETDDAFASEEGYSLKTDASKPEAFDLRERNYITPVRQQSPFGTCWGFGAIAAAESSILSSGLENDPQKLNLSEKQIAWFLTKPIEDPKSPQKGEGIVFEGETSDASRYNYGGFTLYATNMFASGIGPVAEDTVTPDGEVYRYQGKNGTVVNGFVDWYDKDGTKKEGWKKTYYSEDDDWSIPETYRFHQDYKIKESYLLPSPQLVTNERRMESEYQPEATEAIKDQLLQNRAVCISICATHSQPGDPPDEAAFGDMYAQYTDEYSTPNHVVTIVGYDDNFPVTNFKEGCQPEGNGAWLVKNSWGADTNEFPDNGYSHWGLLEGQDRVGSDYKATSEIHTGYFWISYYDKTLQNPEAYSFEAAPPENEIIHQHDFMPVMEYKEYSVDEDMKMANVFTADQNCKLEEVSFFTAKPGTTASFKIILLEDNWYNPSENGLCVYESEPKTYPYGGYHLEKLDKDANVIIARGQQYVVLVDEKTPSGKSSICLGESMAQKYSSTYFNAVINRLESILYMEGEWLDLNNKNLQEYLLGESTDMQLDNFPIKARLSPVDSHGVYMVLNNMKNTIPNYVKTYEEHKFGVTFVGGTDDLPTAPEVQWISSDPDIFTVEPIPGTNNSEAIVTGKSKGEATLIVDGGIYGKKVIVIQVDKFHLTYLYMGGDIQKTVYNGKAQEPEVLDVFGDTTTSTGRWGLIKDQDYAVSYEDNVKCGKGTVTANGIGEFEGSASGWFAIVPAKAKITEVKAGDQKMTVSFDSQKDSGISGYVISYKESGTDTAKTLKVDPSATSAVISGLTPGKTYQVSMKAYVTIEEEDMVIDKETYEWWSGNGEVDYFGEASDTVTSPKITGSTDGDPKDSGSVAGTEKKIKAIKKDGDLAGSGFRPLCLSSKKATNTTIKLTWKKVSGADGYIIYGNRCGTKYAMKKLATLSASKTAWTYKKLKKGTHYKFLILAYKVKNNAKQVKTTSKTIHMATSGGKVGNYKAVKLNKTKVTLKKGKSFTLKAKPVAADKKKKVKKHAAIRYESTNKKIASVSKAGKITAKKKGTCYVYAYAQNGVSKRIKVTVK